MPPGASPADRPESDSGESGRWFKSGGEIRVQSKPNGGSEFTVLLPMIATEAPTHAPEPQH